MRRKPMAAIRRSDSRAYWKKASGAKSASPSSGPAAQSSVGANCSGGAITHSTRFSASTQMLLAIRKSVPMGRWGPWYSTHPAGISTGTLRVTASCTCSGRMWIR